MSVIDIRHGIGVSPGIAVGPVVQVRPPVRPPQDEPASADPAAAGQQIREVLESVAATLEDRAERGHGEAGVWVVAVQRRSAEVLGAQVAGNLGAGPFGWKLGRRPISDAALADGWGKPLAWLEEAEGWFAARSFPAIAEACRRRRARRWSA